MVYFDLWIYGYFRQAYFLLWFCGVMYLWHICLLVSCTWFLHSENHRLLPYGRFFPDSLLKYKYTNIWVYLYIWVFPIWNWRIGIVYQRVACGVWKNWKIFGKTNFWKISFDYQILILWIGNIWRKIWKNWKIFGKRKVSNFLTLSMAGCCISMSMFLHLAANPGM